MALLKSEVICAVTADNGEWQARCRSAEWTDETAWRCQRPAWYVLF